MKIFEKCTIASATLLASTSTAVANPVLEPSVAAYMQVRLVTDQLEGVPPEGAYVTRRIAFDSNGAFGGAVAVATDLYATAPGRIDLVDPVTGATTNVGVDMLRPTALAIPAAGTYGDLLHYFQQFDFHSLTPPPVDFFTAQAASRNVYVLESGIGYGWLPGTLDGVGTQFTTQGMDAGTGLAFAPSSFGPVYGEALCGSDSGNAPGFTSGDGIRCWDESGAFTNVIMGETESNPDTFTDVAFTGPEFGVYADRLIAANLTGVNGENLLAWDEATLVAGPDPLTAYNAREVLYSTSDPAEAAFYRVTYGTYGSTGYLFAQRQLAIDRVDENGVSSPLVTAVPGFNDVDFGAKRVLYAADLGNSLWAIEPSTRAFARYVRKTGCPRSGYLARRIWQTWEVDTVCPQALALCSMAADRTMTCLSPEERETIVAGVEAICPQSCEELLP